MERKAWLRAAYAAGLSMLLSISSIACLLTVFELDASVAVVLLWCAVWSVAFAVSYKLRWQLLPMGVLALLAGYFLQSGALYKSFGGLLFRLSQAYNLVYGWPVLGKQSSADLVLLAHSALVALFVTGAVVKRKSTAMAIVLSALPLLCCAFMAESGPEPVWLGLWLLGIGLLLLTGKLELDRFMPAIAASLAVLSVVLMVLLPQSGQEKPRELAQSITGYLEDIGIGAAPGKGVKTDGGAVQLSKLGSRRESFNLVMTVTSDRGGTVYLRGCAYDTYYRNNWTNLVVRDPLYWPDESLLESVGQVQIHTENAMDMRYFPYYFEGIDQVNRGINNFGGTKDYAYEVLALKQKPQSQTCLPEDAHTQLPTVTERWAEGVLAQLLTEDMTDSQKIAAITSYVRSCAKYNLYVDRMPADEQDFVVWFAESAGKGYCIHFATTAAVLLRAADIPARYVTGYMVQTKAGVPTQVYGKDAHAWVECFLDGVGWVTVEATPGATPSAQTQKEEEKQEQGSPEPVLYISAAVFVATLAGFLLQWRVRVWLRRRKRRNGPARDRLLACYGQMDQMLQLMGQTPPNELTELAQWAKFSPHPVDEQALAQMEQAYKQTRKRLKKESLMKKLHYRLILGLY